MPPKVMMCKNGRECFFLVLTSGCRYHHPAEHIPCKNGAACPFLKKVGGCRFKHDPSPEQAISHEESSPPLFVRIRGLAGGMVDAPSPGGGPVCAYGCGKTTDLKWETCPYASDIHNTDEWGWRCEDCMYEAENCMYEAAMDI